MTNQTGMVFDIQRFALHDGPGIRTTVFLKGCSNRCGWCHNPESLSASAQIQYYPLRCMHCGLCAKACPTGAHFMEGEDHRFDRAKCIGCGLCAGVCNTQALVMSGKQMTVHEVLGRVLEDAAYYRASGGGMTLSGGEPVLQSAFCVSLLTAAKQHGIHTALETAGNYPFERLEPLIPHLDLVLFDVKAWSERIYAEHIHGDRDAMLGTLGRLDEYAVPIIVRTPVVVGANAREGEIGAIAKFAATLKNLRHYQLVPYHALGAAKYDALGEDYQVPYSTPAKEQIERLELVAARYVKVFNQEKGYIARSADDAALRGI